MRPGDSRRQPEYLRRRSQQGFRSRELLASLTVSAEAIALGEDTSNPDVAAARAASRRTTRASVSAASSSQILPGADSTAKKKPGVTIGVASVSKMKLMSMSKLQRMRKYHHLGIQSTLEEEGEAGDEESEANSGTDKSRVPGTKSKRKAVVRDSLLAPAATPIAALSAPKTGMPQTKAAPVVSEKYAIGKFETRDIKWKATIEGEVEKFMYPSLRLEALYVPEDRTAYSRHNSGERKDTSPPSTQIINKFLTTTARVDWELERVPPSAAATAGGLPEAKDEEVKRQQFVQKLAAAEILLCRREAATLGPQISLPASEQSLAPIVPTQTTSFPDEENLAEVTTAKRRPTPPRYQRTELPREHEIPRLPQTRKMMREIQRHSSDQGQIKYFSDKQHLFTKWKKLHTSQQHQLTPLTYRQAAKDTPFDTPAPSFPIPRASSEEDGDSDGATQRPHVSEDGQNEEESDDDTKQPFGKLSPRSLFFHECVKNQILPEPIFSRISETVPTLPVQSVTDKRSVKLSTLADVAAMLVHAANEQTDEKLDFTTTPEGKIVRRKRRHLTLKLQQFGLGDAKTIALSKALRHFQTIQVLDLSDNRLTDASIIPLLQALEATICTKAPPEASNDPPQTSTSTKNPKAKLLAAVAKISRRNGTEELPATRRRGGRGLTVLNLSKNELGRAGCKQIARFLGSCTALSHLDLSHTTLGGDDEALTPLAVAMETHPSLERVILSHNTVGERGGVLLGEMLTKPTCRVRALDVSWNSICRRGAIALGVALRTNTALATLNMGMNRCGDDGGEQMAAALACNSTLTQLDLSRNALGGPSAVAFSFFLRSNRSLRTLQVKDNSLGEVGARALLRAIALGSRCEIHLSVHDLAASTSASAPRASTSSIFDATIPSESSPFELRLGTSPYAFAVATELLDAALVQGRCALSEITYDEDEIESAGNETPMNTARSSARNTARSSARNTARSSARGTARSAARRKAAGKTKSTRPRVLLAVDAEYHCLYDVSDASRRPWTLPNHGTLRAVATFTPVPLPRGPMPALDEEACLGLIRIVQRGFSARDVTSLLDLALADLHLTTTQASFFVAQLRDTIPLLELLGRLWPCLLDGENVFAFLQQHLPHADQRRLIDRFGPVTIQFSMANPTGHWSLALGDIRHRKLALWFATLNAHHANIVARRHPKRTDCSQFGRGYYWRNASFNQKQIQLNYAFFDRLPRAGVLEFDYVSPVRPEDRTPGLARQSSARWSRPVTEAELEMPDQTTTTATKSTLTDEALGALLAQVGAEVCAIYIPAHKRQDLKYQLVLFHLAIAGRCLMSRQAHHILQHFPKNYESGRLRALVALHHALVDLELLGELLERLALPDRPRVYQCLGYLSTVMPLAVDMDFEVDFSREDEKMLLRALVDLSMACPMDMIRIDSARSTVLVIYSMYQTNAVPASGRICFRYVTHPTPNRLDWLRARQQIYRHFLCGDRLKALSDSAALALATSASSNGNSSTPTISTEANSSNVIGASAAADTNGLPVLP